MHANEKLLLVYIPQRKQIIVPGDVNHELISSSLQQQVFFLPQLHFISFIATHTKTKANKTPGTNSLN